MVMVKKRLEDLQETSDGPVGVELFRQELDKQLTDQNVVVYITPDVARAAIRDPRITKQEHGQIKYGQVGEDQVKIIIIEDE